MIQVARSRGVALVLLLGLSQQVLSDDGDSGTQMPKVVVDAIHGKYPGSTFQTIQVTRSAGGTQYALTVVVNDGEGESSPDGTGGRHIAIKVASDGRLLSEEEAIQPQMLPASVLSVLEQSAYAGGQVKSADRTIVLGRDTTYRLKIAMGEEQREVVIDQSLEVAGGTSWQRIECDTDWLTSGESQGECWKLNETPPVFRTVIRGERGAESGPTRDKPNPASDAPQAALPGGKPKSSARPIGVPNEATSGQVWCKIAIAAVYKEVEEQVQVGFRLEKRPDGTTISIPEYETRKRRLVVSPGRTEWRRNADCEVPSITPDPLPVK
jgi:hypothetical protein